MKDKLKQLLQDKNQRTFTYFVTGLFALVILILGIVLITTLFSRPSPNKLATSSIKNSSSKDKVKTSIGKPNSKENILKDNGSKSELYSVTRVVDGDTIHINVNGSDKDIRLIGIDTPETVDPRKPVQCFGQEASNKMKNLVSGKKVSLESDPISGDKDKYGRLLRYIFLEDGTSVNKTMIAEGYAHEYTYDSQAYKYMTEYKEAQKQAQAGNKGLWSPDSCNGNTNSPVDTSKTAPVSVAEPKPTSTQPSNSSVTGIVKKSNAGICHAPGTTYYDKTLNFVSFDSVQACLDSGGRLPKR